MLLVIQICFLLAAPFLFLGIINRIKALWAGRKGAPFLQPLYDFIRLLKKGEVISKTTSFVFQIAPSFNIAAVIFAFLLIPIPSFGSTLSFEGDFVLFAYILGLSKFLTVLAALDTGSSFEGMGASREVTFSTIVEPAFFILIGTLALLTGQISFASIFPLLNSSAGYTVLIEILFTAALFIMIVTEGSRVPVDDPNTHLELTMIHEVMVLDNSGPDFAFILYSSGMKMVLLSMLVANLLIPGNIQPIIAIMLLIGIIMLSAVLIGLVESLIARARMSHVPQFIFLMTALSLIAFAVVVFYLRGRI